MSHASRPVPAPCAFALLGLLLPATGLADDLPALDVGWYGTADMSCDDGSAADGL